jgi:hypothetical protein
MMVLLFESVELICLRTADRYELKFLYQGMTSGGERKVSTEAFLEAAKQTCFPLAGCRQVRDVARRYNLVVVVVDFVKEHVQ